MDLKNRIEDNLRHVLNAIQAMVIERNAERVNDYLGLFGDMLSFYRKNWDISEDWAYGELIRILQDPADLLVAAAMDAEIRCLDGAAVQFAAMAAQITPEARYRICSASYLRKMGNTGKAREICLDIGRHASGDQNVLSELFMCDVADRFWPFDYYDLFARIHKRCPPRVYIEIGVADGKSLALARSSTRAVGIDPASAEQGFLLFNSPENDPQLYKMTSDDFFANMDPRKEMGLSNFSVAFIDGLHHFDQVLRDFIHLEKLAGEDSLILIHDCLPINAQVASRERSTAFWTGDVWKVIPCLRAVRPDLEIVTLPVAPSGVALVRRLNPASRILERQYDVLVQHFDSQKLPDDWADCCKLLNVILDQKEFTLEEFLPVKGWQ